MADFYEWLGATLCEAYGGAFAEYGFDSLEVLCGLTDDQLAEMLDSYVGIVKPGHRYLFLNRLEEVRGGAPVQAHTPLRTSTTSSGARVPPPQQQPVPRPAMPAGYGTPHGRAPPAVVARRVTPPPGTQPQPHAARPRGLFDPMAATQGRLHESQHIAPDDEPDRARDGPVRSPSPPADDLAASAPVDHDAWAAEQQQQPQQQRPAASAKRPKATVSAAVKRPKNVQIADPVTGTAAPAAPWGGAKRLAAAGAGPTTIAAARRNTTSPPARRPAVAAVLKRGAVGGSGKPSGVTSPVALSGSLTVPDAAAAVASGSSSGPSTPATAARTPTSPKPSFGANAGHASPPYSSTNGSPTGPDRGAVPSSAYDSLIAMLHAAPAVQSARAQKEHDSLAVRAPAALQPASAFAASGETGSPNSPMKDLFR